MKSVSIGLLFIIFVRVDGVEVTNLTVWQDYLSRKVIVGYDLVGELGVGQLIQLDVSSGGEESNVPLVSVMGDMGEEVKSGVGKQIIWNATEDWTGEVSGNMRFVLSVKEVEEKETMEGFSRVPEGWFAMGGNSGSYHAPQNLVGIYLSPFWMQTTEVSLGQWKEIQEWAKEHGYTDLPAGVGKANDHPVVKADWVDAVKWCNAASEKAGRTPCYEVGMEVFRFGNAHNIACNWLANGFRLPTESEWEKAAKAGKHRRYPWPGPISDKLANYNVLGFLKPKNSAGSHPVYVTGSRPFTAPVGSFQPNEYGVFDMSGNVLEHCWDWYSETPPFRGKFNPRGPKVGEWRTVRGGGWGDPAGGCIIFNRRRHHAKPADDQTGFRIVVTAKEDKVVTSEQFLSKEVFDFDLEFVNGRKKKPIPSSGGR